VWRQEFFDLTPWAGSTVQMAFHFASHDGYLCCSSQAGWYIDDMRVEASACP
jgi:hypothetical protein